MTITIQQLDGKRGRKRFIDSAWEILDCRRHPNWIPPLRISLREILDPKKNPFFQDADMAFFLAEEEGRPVGRIAALRNGWISEEETDPPGFFGFFECRDHRVASRALIRAAEEWLRGKGFNRALGPTNPSTNYEVGLLVDGFQHPPTIMTPWNPPYYPEAFRAEGYRVAKNLFGWHLPLEEIQDKLKERFRSLTERVSGKEGLTFGSLDFSDFKGGMKRCWEVYSRAWATNWGFCPLSEEEFLFIAGELRPLMVPEGSIIVEAEGELVAFGLFLPDFNRALARDRSGRLLPMNWLRLLRTRRHTPWVRNILVGVLPRYQKLGLLPMILFEAIKSAPAFGVTDLEVSWVLEDNHNANQTLKKIGAHPYRKWQILEREI